MKIKFSAVMFFVLSVALFQDLPAQGQTQAISTFEVVPTPNENSNSELLAASASSSNDIWAVGQSTMHFDGTTWTAYPAPLIKGDNNSFLQGVVAISPTLAWAAGNVTDGAHPGQVIEQWNGIKWSLFPGPKFGKKDQADVFAMTSSSANDVWAIGSLVNRGTGLVSPLFEHWNGTAWTATIANSNNECLFGASADATNDAWAVGFNGSDNIRTSSMHWDGANWKSWTIAPSPSPTKSGFPCDLLWAGVVPSPGNLWILGSVHDGTLAIHMTTGADSSLVSKFWVLGDR